MTSNNLNYSTQLYADQAMLDNLINHSELSPEQLRYAAATYYANLSDNTYLVISETTHADIHRAIRQNRPLTRQEMLLVMNCQFLESQRRNEIVNNFEEPSTKLLRQFGIQPCDDNCVCHFI